PGAGRGALETGIAEQAAVNETTGRTHQRRCTARPVIAASGRESMPRVARPGALGASRYGATDLSILIDTVTRRIVRRRTISLLHDHSLRRRIRDMGRTFRATVRLR